MSRILLGLFFSSLIALFAWRRGSLSASGAAAALLIGTLIYAGGGGAWFAALVVFFATSTLLGKVGRARKAAVKLEFEKGDTRDAWQAFSNGGVAAACALGMLVWPHPLWGAGFLGALSTANGDTWATELGVLSRGEPYSLRTLRRVPRGTSGAVSGLGLAATLAGGALIGAVCAAQSAAFGVAWSYLLCVGALMGVVGSLVDSFLGAAVQRAYHCDACGRATEGPLHQACGGEARAVGGFRGFDNDVVNLCATLAGALIAAGMTAVCGAACATP